VIVCDKCKSDRRVNHIAITLSKNATTMIRINVDLCANCEQKADLFLEEVRAGFELSLDRLAVQLGLKKFDHDYTP
jgi:hypothetical protein